MRLPQKSKRTKKNKIEIHERRNKILLVISIIFIATIFEIIFIVALNKV